MQATPAQLTRLVGEIERHVPFYRAHWARCGLQARQLRFPEDFQSLPPVRKPDLLAAGLEDRLDDRYARAVLTGEKTSGSSGQPFQMLMDRSAIRRRRLRFLRALIAAGCRPGRPLMLIGDKQATPLPLRLIRWRYASLEAGEHALAQEYLRIRPAAVYGPLSALLMLGEHLNKQHPDFPRPQLIVTTAEELSRAQREALSALFGTRIADFYGMTELGLVAWRLDDEPHYRLPAADLLLEFLPCATDAQLERLVVTDLRGGAMPLIRYETGDLVRRDHSLPHKPITRFVGREIDCLRLPGGARISPYRITLGLEAIAAVEQYQVIQQPDFAVEVFIRAGAGLEKKEEVFAQARRAMHSVCGETLKVAIRPLSALTALPGKLRPVRSLVLGET